MEKLLVARQNSMAARMHGSHQQDMIHSQQTAMQIAQAAALHAANQKSASNYHFHRSVCVCVRMRACRVQSSTVSLVINPQRACTRGLQ